jgi:hypothetical protein
MFHLDHQAWAWLSAAQGYWSAEERASAAGPDYSAGQPYKAPAYGKAGALARAVSGWESRWVLG